MPPGVPSEATFPGVQYESVRSSERVGLLVADDADADGDEDFFLTGAARPTVRDAAPTGQTAAPSCIDVAERAAALNGLARGTGTLSGEADELYVASRLIQKRLYVRDLKMKMALATVVLILMLVIVLPIILKQ